MVERDAFWDELGRLERDPAVLRLVEFSQHRGSTTYQHVHNVATCCARLAERLGWRGIDGRALARGAMLHDYYLYDIRDKHMSAWRHGTSHPRRASEQASYAFDLTQKERDIIESHMWPLTITKVPRSREAVLVCLADKHVAFCEMVLHRRVVGARSRRTADGGAE